MSKSKKSLIKRPKYMFGGEIDPPAKDIRRPGDELVLSPIKQLKQTIGRRIPTSTKISIPKIKDDNVRQGTQDYVDWYSNPETLKRFEKNTGFDSKRLQDMTNYGANVTARPVSQSYPLLGEDSQAEFQGYDTVPQEQIIYTPGVDKGVIQHERGHAGGQDTILGPALKRTLGDPFKQTSKNAPKAVKRYMDVPEESYGNFHQFRIKLGLKPGEQIKDIKELQKRVKDTGSNVENFYQTYDDDKILKAINTIASTDTTTEDNIAFAAYGTGQKGIQMKRKKYANGTGNMGTGQVISPNQTLSEFQLLLDNAKIEGESNVWANAIPMVTSLATQFAGSYIGGAGEEVGKVAALGSNNMSGQVEVEGNEVIEQPNSAPVQVKGPSHEQGGIDVNVEEGTKVYSDRIKVGGKTMAERKKARENLLFSLDEKSSTRQGDEATKNSVDRMRSNVEKEEALDLQLQELASNFQNMVKQFANGTGEEGVQKFNGGTNKYGIQFPEQEQPLPTFLNNFNTNLPVDSVNSLQPVGTTYEQPLEQEKNAYFTPRDVNYSPDAPSTASSPNTGYTPTAGDITSLVGDLYSTFAPMNNTKENRAGDTPNINTFKDFGQDALKTNDDSLGLVKSQAANSETRLRRNAVATKRSARGTSRSINTQRATDTLIDLETNAQGLTVDDNLSKQMMAILGNKSNLQNTRDQVVMGGDQQKDLADRQDRDNFYTQMAQDISTKGQGIQQTGKDLNAVSENQMYMKMLNQMSKYFQFDSQGNIIGTNQAKK
jgi:hypothetical protein